MKPFLQLKTLFHEIARWFKALSYRSAIRFLKYYIGGLIELSDKNHLFLFSAGLAYSLLICIMPFVLILISLLGNLMANESIRDQLSQFFDTVIPYSEYAEFVKNIITNRIDEIRDYKNIAGYIGVVGLFFAASGFFSTLRTILNRTFNASIQKHFLIAKLRDFGMILILIILFLVATMVMPFWNALIDTMPILSDIPFIDFDLIKSMITFFSSPFMLFILFFIFYDFIPYDKMNKKVVAVSALWATIFWTLAEELFGFFLVHFASFKRIYGAYVFIIVVVIWIYYSAVVFLLGAQIGQLYKERREKRLNTQTD